MKIYICYTIPDYIGIDIMHIFSKEEDAKRWVEDYLKEDPYNKYDDPGYDEWEIEDKYNPED